jgi:hypothetical protein
MDHHLERSEGFQHCLSGKYCDASLSVAIGLDSATCLKLGAAWQEFLVTPRSA